MTDELTQQIDPSSSQEAEGKSGSRTESFLDSPLPAAESPPSTIDEIDETGEPSGDEEVPEEAEEVKEIEEIKEVKEKPKRAKRKPRWWNSKEWVWLKSHRRLAVPLKLVTLERTSERLGRVVKTRINHIGRWVWKPDADEIIKLGKLASCNGVSKINRPFFIGRPSREALKHKPEEPPAEE